MNKQADGVVASALEHPEVSRQKLGFARSLAWVSLVLVLILSAVLTILIGNEVRETLLAKQRSFAGLMAENLNNQIYRRFTLPTVLRFRRIALRQPVQYEALDQVVQSIIHGLHVENLRIYGYGGIVTYAINQWELGRSDLATQPVMDATMGDQPIFTLDSAMPLWQAFFMVSLDSGTFTLRTTYPLRIENRVPSSGESGPIMGVLEFTQDITDDMEDVIGFQWGILGVTLVSSLALFLMLLFFIRRADHGMAQRVAQEQRLLRELHQHEKLASMGRVVASIAHEIRNPLGIIRSSAELLLKRPGTDPVGSRILQAIYDESKRLSQTVSDFLDYAKPKPLSMGIVDLAQIVRQALIFLEHEFKSREIEAIAIHPLDVCYLVNGDKDLLYRAIYNILSNAIQAIGSKGLINVDITEKTGKSKTVVMTIKDSGPGFDQHKLNQYLDPFFTTKDDGTGLGLPIVSSILLSHGGSLALGNASGGGGLVSITLPSASDEDILQDQNNDA